MVVSVVLAYSIIQNFFLLSYSYFTVTVSDISATSSHTLHYFRIGSEKQMPALLLESYGQEGKEACHVMHTT